MHSSEISPILKNNKYEKTLADELDWNTINQLHSATLNISNQSFEIKKLCVTIEIAVLAFIAKFSQDKVDTSLFITGFIVPLMFYGVDCVTYFYQDKLRGVMIVFENTIRSRYELPERNNEHNKGNRKFVAMFNHSHWLYAVLIVLDIAIYLAYKFGAFGQ